MTEPQGGVSKSDYSFGQVAIRENVCTFEQVKECLDIQSKLRGLGIEPKKLGEILIEKGYVTSEQAVKIAKLQSQAASSTKVAIPGYEILAKIGAGAMGTVYKGRQVSMDRIVAIKILAGRYAKDTVFVDRFVREARAVAKLNHENIIGGIDVGEAGGLHYFVMEFVDGVPVHTTLKREGRIEEKKCLQIALQMGKALSHAHKHGIVHRDVKPENIMITGAGVAKLCDLGLAKQTKGDADVTMDGTSVGTPNYISPEQARGEEKIDIRTDIYSLGASLYHMATGSTPFTGANAMVVMTKHVTEYPDPPKKRFASLSEGFNNLVIKMMQKRREDRHQNPEELISDLEMLLRGGEIDLGPAPRAPSAVVRPASDRPIRPSTVRVEGLAPRDSSARKPIMIGLGVAAVVVVGVLVVNAVGGSGMTPPQPPKNDPSTVRTTTNTGTGTSTTSSSSSADAAAQLKKEIADFRRWSEGNLTGSTADRFTAPYGQLQKMIAQHKAGSNFEALTAWQEEQATFVEKANKFILEKAWEPVRAKADENLAAGRVSKALEELAKFEEVFKYLGEGKTEKTRATRQLEERLQRIEASADQAWLEGKQNADRQFGEASTRDQAYTSLDVLIASLLPRQKKDVEDARAKYFESEVGALVGTVPTPDRIKQAQGRVAKLRSMHSGNEPAAAALDAHARQLKEAYENFSKGALAQANSLYAAGFKPKFEEAMRQRDLVSVRRNLNLIYHAKETAALQTYLLPASIDPVLLKSFCDPARTAPVDWRKLVQQAEEGHKVASKPGQAEGARDLYFDLRTTALLEDLVDLAAEGAKLASRDAGRFKVGYGAPLKDASAADPVRKANEGVTLVVNVAQGGGKATVNLAVTPKKDPALSEEDLVRLAERAKPANDGYFALKAFLLFHYTNKPAYAKAWWDKIPPDQRAGLERMAEGLKDVVSATAELEAKQLYEEGHALWKKKDEAGAIRKFRECLEKYSNTAYMKSPLKLSTAERSRIQIVEEMFKLTVPAGASGAGAKTPVKAALKDVFLASEVRDLGKGRFDVTWVFKEDRELAAFQTVPGAFGGQLAVTRVPAGGVRVGGGGLWSCTVPLKGDVLLEVSFKMENEKPLGFVVHGQGDQAGYAVMVDLDIPGAGQLDAVFKMPIQLGAQFLTSILAQGGKDLDVTKDVPSTARLERVGTKIRCAVNRGTIEADNAQFNDGRVGLILPDSNAQFDKVRIVGEVDKAWLDAAIKVAESAAPQK